MLLAATSATVPIVAGQRSASLFSPVRVDQSLFLQLHDELAAEIRHRQKKVQSSLAKQAGRPPTFGPFAASPNGSPSHDALRVTYLSCTMTPEAMFDLIVENCLPAILASSLDPGLMRSAAKQAKRAYYRLGPVAKHERRQDGVQRDRKTGQGGT